MKISTLLLLPLAVSAAVIRPQQAGTATIDEITPVRRQTAPKPSATESSGWLPTLAQVGSLLNSAYSTYNQLANNFNDYSAKLQGALPDLLYAGVNSAAWYMSWKASPVRVETVPAMLMPKEAQKKMFTYGPFTLTGSKYNRTATAITMDSKADIIIRTLRGLPDNAAILSGKMDLILEDGTKADVAKGVYVHHLLVADVGKTSAPFALCPGGHNQKDFVPWLSSHIVESIGAGLIQAGNDQFQNPTIYASPTGPMKSAFLTGWSDTFLLEAEIVNYNPENTTIFMTVEAEYIDNPPADYLDASTLIFSATGCNSPGYRPPQGAKIYNFTSELFSMNRDGYLLNMRGHLHDGGTSIQMYLNDDLACESFPKYENLAGAKKPDGTSWQTITEMSYCDKPVQFRKGDNVKLVSNYDTTKHPLREGTGGGEHGGMEGMDMAEEMGIFTVNIASKRNSAPASPKNAPVPIAPKQPSPKQPAVAPPAGSAAPPAKPMAGMGGHSHGGKMIRGLPDAPSIPHGSKMMRDLPEALYPLSVVSR